MNKQSNTQSHIGGGIFGLVTNRKTSKIIITPVPWEVTTSYGGGTSHGPKAIFEASPQIDLYDIEFGEAYTAGFFLEKEDPFFKKTNSKLKLLAQKIIKAWDKTGKEPKSLRPILSRVNAGCDEMVDLVYKKTNLVLKENKIPGLIGGDHSTPLGAIRAISEKYAGNIGVLHIDAHADLRNAYHGFQHSHASIMRNVCELKTPPKKLVQVGIRDFCKEEFDYINQNPHRIHTFFDNHLKASLLKGISWQELCVNIVEHLPHQVYISFDIDGLSPEFCPHTGTPVPGGLSFDQATFLIAAVANSGRKIVGFDLNEVAPGKNNEWDGNVGARILFKLCGWAAQTNTPPK